MDHIELQVGTSQYGYKTLEISVNGRLLIELVREVEQPFADREGRAFAAGQYDWLGLVGCELFDDTSQEFIVLGCTCGEAECWPLLCKIEFMPGHVRWSGFYNPFRTVEFVAKLDDTAHERIVPWAYSGLGCFEFDRLQYKAAFGALEADLAAEQIRLQAQRAEYLARQALEGEL
jgi:hypothetical protein